MADTKVFRRGAPPLVLLIAAIAGSAFAGGCGDDGMGSGGAGTTSGTMSTTQTSASSSPTTSTTSPTTSTGTTGSGGAGSLAVTPAGDEALAFDATPDPGGTVIYFTAIDPVKGAGVFQVPTSGANLTPSEVQSGAPFVAPFGIATSTDGNTLYVADVGGDSGTAFSNGVIYSLSSGGSTPAVVSGSANVQARGLEIHADANNADIIYFTGRDVTDGQPGLFTLPAAGGAVTVVAKGSPFVDPSGVAVASDGTAYVLDTVAAGSHTAQLFKVDAGGVVTAQTVTLPNSTVPFTVGFPAGVAVSPDGGTIYLSGLGADRSDAFVSIQGATVTVLPNPGFFEGAGLHRAKNVNVFAWADSAGGPSGGRVSVIK